MRFGEQRVYWASTLIETRDGEVYLRPGQGTFMGDWLVVRFFAQHFQEPVADWQCKLAKDAQRGMGCYARDPVTGSMADLSLTGYAGDLFKKVIEQKADLTSMKQHMAKVQGLLSECTEFFGYIQNAEKWLRSCFLWHRVYPAT